MLKKIILITLLVLFCSGISFVGGVIVGGYCGVAAMPYVQSYQKLAADGTLNKIVEEANKNKGGQ